MSKNKDRIIIQIVCVIAAIITWLFVINQMNPATVKDIASVPVIVTNGNTLDEFGLVVANVDIKEINVQVEGYRNDIININKNDIYAYIDVQGYKEGLNRIPIEIKLPEGYTLSDYSPKQVLCELEAVVNRTIDLTIEIDGRQLAGYYVGKPISSVNSVIIRGPRSVLNSAEKAVALFNINGASGTLDKKIPIDVYSDKGLELNLVLNPEIAEITVPIYPTKWLNINVPISGLVKEGYEIKSVTVEPESILVAADEKVLKSMDHILAEPIDIEGATYKVYESIQLVGGNYLLAEDIKPVVTIDIEKIITVDYIYNRSEIQFINIPEGFDIQFLGENDYVLTNVSGLASYINETSREDIKIMVDLQGISLGNNKVRLYYETDKNIKNVVFDNEYMDINLIEKPLNPGTSSTTSSSTVVQ